MSRRDEDRDAHEDADEERRRLKARDARDARARAHPAQPARVGAARLRHEAGDLIYVLL